MADSIHPENNDIIQNESEISDETSVSEATEADIPMEDEVTGEKTESEEVCEDTVDAYDDYEEENSGTDDTPQDEAQSDENAVADSEGDAALASADSASAHKKANHFSSRFKLFLANAIYAFLKLDKKKRKKYLTVFCVVFALFILIVTDIIPILPNSYHRSYVGNQYTVGEAGHSASASYRKGVIYANDGAVMCFGPDMKLLSRIDTFSGAPFIRTSGNGAVVYAKNGNKALVMTSEKNHKLVNSDEAVISASVNEKGDYVLVTNEAGYTACVSAFDYNSKSLYKWHTGNNILDTAISPNGQNIVASCVEYSDIAIYSKLIFLDVASKEPVMEIELDSNIATELVFLDANTLLAIGDTFTAAYTPTGNQKWHIDYDGKLLKTYDLSDDGTIAFLFNRYNSALSESFIEIYNTRGRKVGSYQSSDNVRSLSLNNNYCLLTLEGATVLLDSDGDVRKEKKLTGEYSSLELYQNYNFAFGMTNGVVEIVSVKH